MSSSGYNVVTGMVIGSMPMGEYDRRIVLLTREMGKISCFAKGARRPGNPLMAATDLFCYGQFRFYAGRSSYTVTEAEIANYFPFFRTHFQEAALGSYFLEVLDFCTRENNDESRLLLLLYRSLQAMETGRFDLKLIRAVFEIRAVREEGEFPGVPENIQLPESVRAALQHIAEAPIRDLYSFTLEEEPLSQLMAMADRLMDRTFHHRFASLDILEVMLQ
ncbi:MAG: DNA repair protein RecO [Lachnospiraceae bacterium]|nr:DNA repair protein RecO [Lachnospiraceae bacterium]